ncbi:MAG: DUF262 domain-containing protein [Candidatus Eremiobacterota bacterium]
MLFRPLTRRPTATTVTVRELIQKVMGGEVRIPRFQRPLRWQAENVVQLLDSIWRGYPVGSLLFWKRRAGEDGIPVGGAILRAPRVDDAWWVVDGQQRTTALAPEGPPRDEFAGAAGGTRSRPARGHRRRTGWDRGSGRAASG